MYINYLLFLASATFSAARFSAAKSCWIPCVWLAIFLAQESNHMTCKLLLEAPDHASIDVPYEPYEHNGHGLLSIARQLYTLGPLGE